MSLPPSVQNTAKSADNQMLRFGCPACGVRLVVDQSIAGTEGPCPSCGASIVAPPLGVTPDIDLRKASPLAVKPRQATGGKTAEAPAEHLEPLTDIPRLESVYKPSRRRSVSPSSAISNRHQEKSNTLLFFKILCAFLVVALIVAGVYLWLK